MNQQEFASICNNIAENNPNTNSINFMTQVLLSLEINGYVGNVRQLYCLAYKHSDGIDVVCQDNWASILSWTGAVGDQTMSIYLGIPNIT
jgi:hypothetical protein